MMTFTTHLILILLFQLTLVTKPTLAFNESYTTDRTLIFLEENKFYCHMYSDNCKLNILTSLPDFNREKLTTSNSDVLSVLSVSHVLCSSNTKKCYSLINDMNKSLRNQESLKKFQMYSVHLDPIMIGKEDLIVFQMNNQSGSKQNISFPVVIKEPQRLIDQFFRVFVWTMGVFFSALLGLLLEKEQLMMLSKKPVAPLCGFLIQYTCMPLVNE